MSKEGLQQASCNNIGDTAYGSRRSAGTTMSASKRSAKNYASPSVSNIAALIASVADLPAQTTNWNAG